MKRSSNDEVFSIRDKVESVLERFQQMVADGEKARGLSTGIAELDRMAGGLWPGKVIVIASRPSMGKTTLMLNIAEHICIEKRVPTLIFSGDMSSFDIVERILLSRSRFEIGQLYQGHSPKLGDLRSIQKTVLELNDANLIVNDTPGIPIDALCAHARRAKREYGIGFIAIDHLHLLKSNTRQARQSQEREVAVVSAGIKALAKELDIPILVLAQLNHRPGLTTGDQDGIPHISDLADSIEQNAAMIGLLNRAAYCRNIPDDQAELILVKNRCGPTGLVPLTFDTKIGRFESPSSYQP